MLSTSPFPGTQTVLTTHNQKQNPPLAGTRFFAKPGPQKAIVRSNTSLNGICSFEHFPTLSLFSFDCGFESPHSFLANSHTMDEDFFSSIHSDVEENQSFDPSFWLSEDVLDENAAFTQPLLPNPSEVDQSVRQSCAFSLT